MTDFKPTDYMYLQILSQNDKGKIVLGTKSIFVIFFLIKQIIRLTTVYKSFFYY